MRKLDAIDWEILSLLYRNSGMSNKELASRLGIAQSTTLERVRRLREDGVIEGQRIRVCLKRLGINMQAMAAIRLARHTPEVFTQFRDDVLRFKEVISLYHMGGENDFFIHLAVRDAEHLRDFIYKAFTSREEVAHVETAIVYEHREGPFLPRL
jgi:DNA-binding Lrp family transcriptional regulator